MGAASKNPPIGSMVWFTTDHLYSVKGQKYNPLYEYSVYQGEIIGYRTGSWTDVQIRYMCEEGFTKLIDVRLSADEPTIFDNPKDAALFAQKLTEKHLGTWGWMWRTLPDLPPMRREWEKYLKPEANV